MTDPSRLKVRIVWAVIALAAAVAFYFWGRQSAPVSETRRERNVQKARERGVTAPPNAVPPMTVQLPAAAPTVVSLPPPARLAPEMVIPIQDRSTIDFSIGAPVVRSGGTDTEVLDRALREMEEATKNMTFPPPKPAPAEPKK